MDKAVFILIPRDIAIRLDITSTAKILYGLLDFRQGDNHDSFWTVRSIARDMGRSAGAIEKATTQLEKLELLEVKRGSRKTRHSAGIPNRYRIKHLPEKTIQNNERLPEKTIWSSTEGAERLPEKTEKNNTKENQNKREELPKISFDPESGELVGITEDHHKNWAKVYPGVNLGHELLKATSWLTEEPNREKKSYERFLANWFNRALGNLKSNPTMSEPVKYSEGWWATQESRLEEQMDKPAGVGKYATQGATA